MGMVGFREPFARLFHQGWVQMGGSKMSKSKGNIAGPDELVAEYGADAMRLYILFMGPADQDMEWTESGIEGIGRFLRRLWRVVHEVAASAPSATGRGWKRRGQSRRRPAGRPGRLRRPGGRSPARRTRRSRG